ncbi:hypothetical protein PR202_ga29173 [Eleusine coracana subsp. coracana]|uniref:Uncharacterized protein n=1 Tax=Eleusine coracana subsp. coracana TaxID=191504 RepID=A0AAV5DKM8_ELECO|nr:hypothetical protein PR202_ga29173 [Eleusine coracana subsp. coracana]
MASSSSQAALSLFLLLLLAATSSSPAVVLAAISGNQQDLKHIHLYLQGTSSAPNATVAFVLASPLGANSSFGSVAAPTIGEQGLTLYFICCNPSCGHRWRD